MHPLATFLADAVQHRGRLAPVTADPKPLVEAGLLRHVDTLPSGTRWYRLTSFGESTARAVAS